MPRDALPAAAIVIALCGFLLTLDRAPIAWGDSVLYASVTRSLATAHPGAPSVLATSPTAVDYVRFYGPVFFRIEALSFRFFGFSLASARLVSLAGAVLVALAGALIVRALGGRINRQMWTSALLLFTPELGFSATNGRMDSLAVGLGMAALAVCLRGLARETSPLRHGLAAGLVLGAAALTTPRMLPFVFAVIFGSAAVFLTAGLRRSSEWFLLGAMTIGCSTVIGAWTVRAHGGPIQWAHYLIAIVPAVGVDVAFSPAAVRDWQAEPWRIISSLAAVLGAVVAATGLVRSPADNSGRGRAAILALTVTAVNFIVVALSFNLTFIFSTYFAIPLLAVVFALPREWFAISRSSWRLAGVLILALFALVRLGKCSGAALTWTARDPDLIERFVDANVPDGSDVMGKASLYFYAVEEAGSRMLRAEPYSYADWATWAPRATTAPRPPGAPSAAPLTRRFFLWPADDAASAPPPEYECADRRLVAVYEPPLTNIEWLGSFASLIGTPGYPRSNLYELGPSCGPAESHSSRRRRRPEARPLPDSLPPATRQLPSRAPPERRG